LAGPLSNNEGPSSECLLGIKVRGSRFSFWLAESSLPKENASSDEGFDWSGKEEGYCWRLVRRFICGIVRGVLLEEFSAAV
jgi:hypothetical protein